MEPIPTPILVSACIAIVGILLGEYYSYKRLQHEKKTKMIGWLHELNTGHYTHLVQYSFGLSEWMTRLKSSKDDEDLLHVLYMIAAYMGRVRKLVTSTGGIYLLNSMKSSEILSGLSRMIRSELVECTGNRLDEFTDIEESIMDTPKVFGKHLQSLGLTQDLFESLRKYPEQSIEKLTKCLKLYYELLNFEIYSLYEPLYGKEIKDQLIDRKPLHKLAERCLNLENLEKGMLADKRKMVENIGKIGG